MGHIEKGDYEDVEELSGVNPAGDNQSTTTKSTIDKVEADLELEEILKNLGLRLDNDGCLNWRMDASTHPRNWSVSRRAFDTSILLALDLYT